MSRPPGDSVRWGVALGDIAIWNKALGTDADKIRFWFVTVESERDTVDLLRGYVSRNPGVTGTAGNPKEVAKTIAALRVYAGKVPLGDGDYKMDHSAFVMLFDHEGRFADLIRYQDESNSALAKLRLLIASG